MTISRQQLEAAEAQTLSRFATFSGDSKGRTHDEHESAYRTPFQRDRDRIIHSEAFRKLEYKTQVFVNDEGDYYRTRLTHTLEVAQIGRTMARALGVNEDLTEAICLAHDLGHPPFGHAGEHTLNRLMEGHGGFNHNHQSYRVVTELEQRYPDWRGLNLSHETLEGIVKHETEYDVSEASGYDPALCGSLEAQIANIADELAYNAHDLDDGLAAGLFDAYDLQPLDIWQRVVSDVGWKEPEMTEIDRHRIIRELVGLQVTNVLDVTTRNLAEADMGSVSDVQHLRHSLVRYSEEQSQQNASLKRFLYDNMYRHYRVVRMQERAGHFLEQLFNSYVHEPRQLPPMYQEMIERRDVYRVVADYIAGMTDRSAHLEYRQMFDPTVRP